MILKDVIKIIDNKETDLTYSGYSSVEELVQELELYIAKHKQNDQTVIRDIGFLFASTGAVQEISINKGELTT